MGAGPAGSVTAFRLASAGASVLLLDRYLFPRDKPCGGGLTKRAVDVLGFPVDPVVEDVVFTMDVSRGGDPADRIIHRSDVPLVYMTQRRKLDAWLAGKAADAGADFRDGLRIRTMERTQEGFTLYAGSDSFMASYVVGADGVNGVTAKQTGLGSAEVLGVALEGNWPLGRLDAARYRGRAVVEIGTVPGGYGWVFPKGDHVNFGVGGWTSQGKGLRGHLAALCLRHGVRSDELSDVRGYRLPTRNPHVPLGHGRALLVGDAAGLVDPLTGDGIYEAFVSANFAADAVTSALHAGNGGPADYDAAIRHALAGPAAASWDAKLFLERWPGLVMRALHRRFVWKIAERVITGPVHEAGSASCALVLAQRAMPAVSALVGGPGRDFRRSGSLTRQGNPQGAPPGP